MGSLFAALNSASNALDAFQRSIDVTQNNVTNANSPGYAKQIPTLQSANFVAANGLSGGVVEQTQDSRNQFADSMVRSQLSIAGAYQQLQTSLAPLQNVFDVSDNSAIPSALNQLFQSFSQWSTQPANADYQSAVVNAAQQVSAAFQQTAAQLSTIRGATDQSLQSTVAQINQDAAKVQAYNVSLGKTGGSDAGSQANLEATLEDLSNLANVQVLTGVGGTVTVLLGGQTPLVIGTQLNSLQVQADTSGTPGAPPNAKIVDSSGTDVTGQVTSGALSGLLTVRNNILPSLAGGGTQAGSLNTLAQNIADSVNDLLTQGSTTATPPYQSGIAMFTYNAASPTSIASSLNVNPALTPDQLAATDPGPPAVSNGIALQLSNLGNAANTQLGGLSFTQYFSAMTAQVGNAVNSANTGAAAQSSVVSQAKNLQQQLSGVSLDEEAVRLVQLQSAYQAASKVVTVIDELTQTLINMVQ